MSEKSPPSPGRAGLLGQVSRRGAIAGMATLGAAASAPAAERQGPGFAGKIGPTLQQSRPDFPPRAKPRTGSPNVVVILLDDVGFADLGCFGGEIDTPAADALAAGGLRYVNFRTTAVCSSTRASLLTGLNPHSAGVAWLTDLDAGFPGYRGDLSHDAATLPETLRAHGYSTYQCGKWHINFAETDTTVGPMDNWPLQRGFDRAYWFQGHSTDYFRPAALFEGNQQVFAGPAADYYVTDDLTDRAIAYVREHRAQAPDRPFLLYLAPAAAHSPLHARREDLEAVRGRYDLGWDAVREQRLARQKALGVVPADTQLPPPNPGVGRWDDLSGDERRLYARYMEAYAACLRRVDWNIGRLVATLRDLGQLDNTLLILASDNGGSPDGGLKGTTNLFAGLNGGVPLDRALEQFDEIGGPNTYPMYPAGWAMASNTPYRLHKHDTHLGGVADPLIVHWPATVRGAGQLRRQYTHVMDLLPTILDCAGCPPLREHAGRAMRPIQGISFRPSLAAAGAPETRLEQHFEMNGQRAMYADGWRLVSTGRFGEPNDRWELFDLRSECNEITDMASARPDMVAMLEAKWLAAARRYDVFPVDSRSHREKSFVTFFEGGGRANWDLIPPLAIIPAHAAPMVFARSHRIDIDLAPIRPGDEGVLIAYGNQFLGFVLYVKRGRLHYEATSHPHSHHMDAPLPRETTRISYEQTMTERPWRGRGALLVDGRQVVDLDYERAIFGRPPQGLEIGANSGGPVSRLYAQPFRFSGTIERVRIHLETSPYSEAEIRRFMDGLSGRLALSRT